MKDGEPLDDSSGQASCGQTGSGGSGGGVQPVLPPFRRPILGPDPCHCTTGTHPPRTVFSKALDAVHMSWSDPQLTKIMSNGSMEPSADSATAPYWVNEVGQMLWQEHIPTAAARVDALKTHGLDKEAVRLAVAVVRTMKYNQLIAYTHWQQQQHGQVAVAAAAAAALGPHHPSLCYTSWEGWIGHSLNPVGCLFETLAEACIVPEDRAKTSPLHHLGKAYIFINV